MGGAAEATRAVERSPAERIVRTAVPVAAIWLVAGAVLAQATGRVKDWFVMSDELYYERLAISIAHSGSPLPHLHGQLVPNVDQLLPLLLAPFYRSALVPAALHQAHIFDAFVMTSAAVPAYLLARRVARDRPLALAVALLTVAVPWLVYADQLLTEVVAYPAFLWAILGIQRAVAEPRLRNDALALGGVLLATLARTQLLALGIVLPLAILAHAAARRRLEAHRLLLAVYGAVVAGGVALAATGGLARALGTYRSAGQGDLLPPDFFRAVTEHLSAVALATAILPFLVATGWALARAARPRDRERAAFAAVLLVTLVVLALEVTSFDLRYTGPAVNDRYLFYLVPLVLVGLATALADPPWPRLALAAPTAIVALGFSGLPLPTYQKLNFDRPLALVYEHLTDLAGTAETARLGLVIVTVAAAALLVEATLLLRRTLVAAVVGALAAVALPAQTGAAFTRYFSVDGTSGRPLTLDQGGVFDWIDRAVGPTSTVAMLPYPVVPGDYWAGTAFWWDAEFWNESVTRDVVYRNRFYVTSSGFPKLNLRIDPRTGATNARGGALAAQAQSDARFRVAGPVVASARGVDVIRAGDPWRAAWTTSGLYDDGWMRPGEPATIHVFPRRGQTHGIVRYLDIRLAAPSGTWPYRIVLPTGAVAGTATENTDDNRIDLCVPASGHVDIGIESAARARIYGDPQNSITIGQQREVGLRVAQIALADELGPSC